MANQNANATPPLSWKDWLAFLSPHGQQQIVDFVTEARETRGENWIGEIQAEFPLASWIAELVCTRPAAEAFDEIAAAYPDYPIWIVKKQLLAFHAKLKYEIEKPR